MANFPESHPLNEPIHLAFRYSEREYVQAMRSHFATRLRLKWDIVVILILAICTGFFWNTEGMQTFVGVTGMGSLILSAMLVGVFFAAPRRMFRRNPKLRDEYSLTFSDEGIHFRTAHIDSQLAWTLYTHAIVNANSYLLYYGESQLSVIPKRLFQSTEQQLQFEQLLARHIPKITRRGKSPKS
jgi:hypothetical protein